MKESSVITAASAMNISEHTHGKPPVSPTKSLERSPTKRMHSNFFNKDSSTIVSYSSNNNSQYEKSFDLKGSSGGKTMEEFLSSSINSERNITGCVPPTDAFQNNNNIVSTSESNFLSRTTLDQEFKYNLPDDISKNEPYRLNYSEESTRTMPLKLEEQPDFSYNNTKSSLTDVPLPISRFDPTKEEGDVLMNESNRGLDPLKKDDLLVPPDFTTMSSTLRVVPRNNINNNDESYHHSSSDLALNTTTEPISFAPPDKKNLLNDDDDQSYIDHSQPTPPIDLNLLGKQRADDVLPQNSREPQEQKRKNYQVDDLTISYTKQTSQQGVVPPSDDFIHNQKVDSKTPPLDPRMFGNDSVNTSGSISNSMTYERSEDRTSTMGMSTMTPLSAPQETTHEVKYGTYNYNNHGISTNNKESSRSLHQTSDHHTHTDTVVNHSETSRYGENETWRSPDRHLLRPINETCYNYGVKPRGDSLSDHGGRRMSAEYNSNMEESYSHRSENTSSNNSIPQSGFMMRDEYNNIRDQVSPRSWNGSMSRQTFRPQYSDHLYAGFDERSTTSSLNGSMRRRMTPSQTDTISNSGSSVSARNYYNPVPSPASSRHTAGRSRTMCDLLIEGDIDGMSGISTPERRNDTSFGVPKSYQTKKLLSDVQMKLNELEESSEAGKSLQKRNNNVDGDRGKISRSSSFSSTGSSLIDRCQGILDGRSSTPIGEREMRTPTRRTTQKRSLQNTGTYHRHVPSHEENDALDTVSVASSIVSNHTTSTRKDRSTLVEEADIVLSPKNNEISSRSSTPLRNHQRLDELLNKFSNSTEKKIQPVINNNRASRRRSDQTPNARSRTPRSMSSRQSATQLPQDHSSSARLERRTYHQSSSLESVIKDQLHHHHQKPDVITTSPTTITTTSTLTTTTATQENPSSASAIAARRRKLLAEKKQRSQRRRERRGI